MLRGENIIYLFCLSSEITVNQTSFTHVLVGIQGQHNPVLISALSHTVRLSRNANSSFEPVTKWISSQSELHQFPLEQPGVKWLAKGHNSDRALSASLWFRGSPTWNSTHDFCISSPEATNLIHVGVALIGKRLKDFTVFPYPCERQTMTRYVCTGVCMWVFMYMREAAHAEVNGVWRLFLPRHLCLSLWDLITQLQ